VTGLARRIWKWTAGLFAGVAILLALLVGAFRIVVAHAPDYRQPIADWASGLIGLPVEIDQLDVRFGLGGPELVFRGATILSADRSEPLFSAGRASLSLDVTRLLFRWRVTADTFTVDGLQIDVARSEDGRILVFDRDIAALPRGSGAGPIEEMRVRDARVVFRDRMAGGRSWVLDNLQAVLEPDREGVRLEGRFRPPQDLAASASFWATTGNTGVLRTYLGVTGLDLSALHQLPGIPAALPSDGTGDFRLWVDAADGEISQASAEISLHDLRLGFDEMESAEFVQLAGRVEWDRRPLGWGGRIEDLHVRRVDGEWRSSRIAVETTASSGREATSTTVDADFLRLEDLRPFVPLVGSEKLREALVSMQPSGDVSDLSVTVNAGGPEAGGYRVEARADLSRLAVKPWEKVPGISGLSGQVRTDPKGGRIELDSRDFALDFPRLFRDALTFDTARGLVVWSGGSEGLTVIGDGLAADNRDLKLAGGFRLRLSSADDPGRIDVQARVTDVDMSSKSRYLPVGIMPPKVVAWLDSAIVSGRAPEARLNLQGPLKGFPYPGGEGLFEVTFSTEDMTLAYATGWPDASLIDADVLFRNQGLSATIRSASISGLDAADVEVGIPVLREGKLAIKGGARGPLADLLRYTRESPLREIIGPTVDDIAVDRGAADVAVDIFLPLQDLAARNVVVDIGMADARVRYGQMVHALDRANGRLVVDNDKVTASGITGTFLDEPVTVDVGPDEGGGTVATARSVMTARALTESLGLPLKAYLAGTAPSTAYARFPRRNSGDRFRIDVESTLEGMAVTLPDPVSKSAGESVPLVINVEFPEPEFTVWNMRYGERLGAALGFKTGAGKMEFERATILGGSGVPTLGDARGMVIRGEVDRLPVLEWLGVRFGDRTEGRPEDVLTSIDVQAEHLRFGGQHFGPARCRLEQKGDHWLANLDGETISGTVDVPMDRESGVPMELDMQRLYLDDDPEDGGGGVLDPKDVPAMNVAAEDFRMEGLHLGQLEVRIESVPNGFRLERVNISGPDHVMTAEGYSLLGFGQDESQLQLDVSTADLGAAMEYIGFQRTVEAKSATLEADIHWTGGWPQHLLEVAEGTAHLDIKSGSLTEVKPGAGRMFGLLSVQALPRRLTLDFRDVFKKGFFFDEFRGDFSIKDGMAYTDNLVFRSPAADIGIVGSVDLNKRLYDQTAIVSAEIGNTLPVVGAIAAGPAIGAGLFVLKEIFKEPLRGMVNVQYRITGPWENPVVEKVSANEDGGGTAQPKPSEDAAKARKGDS